MRNERTTPARMRARYRDYLLVSGRMRSFIVTVEPLGPGGSKVARLTTATTHAPSASGSVESGVAVADTDTNVGSPFGASSKVTSISPAADGSLSSCFA